MDTSDDEMLPSVLGECYSPEKLFKIQDIVWAKYRKFYWPAVVKSINKKKKKLNVFFIDSPDQPGMKIPFSRAISFNSLEGKALKKQAVEPTDLAETFSKTLKTVEEYLCKRVLLNKQLCPIKFFKCPLDTSDDLTSSSETSTDEKQCSNSTDPVLPDASRGSLSEKNAKAAETEITRKEIAETEAAGEIDSLLKLIHSNSCRNHLKKILEGKTPCERHKKFSSRTPSVRRQLRLEAGFGPIYNRKEFSDITESLHSCLKESTSSKPLDVNSYLFDVWIPEAITWALKKHHKISSAEAKTLFIQTYSI